MAVHRADIESALNDMDFPAAKEAIVQHAEQSGASAEVVAALRSLPVGEYGNKAEVLRSVDLPPADSPYLKPMQARMRKNRVAEHMRDPGIR
jgi:hypothetical protein